MKKTILCLVWGLTLAALLTVLSLTQPVAARAAETDTDTEIAAEVSAGACALDAAHQACCQTLDQLIEQEYDNYCYYYTADDYRLMYEDYEGSFGGVGISMTVDEAGYILVYSVLNSGPARDTRIQPGDRITAVNGESIIGLDTSQAALKIRGEIGSEVTLTLLTPEDEEYVLTLARAEIHSESILGERIEEAENTAYILIYDFTEQTPGEFETLYNQLRQEGPIDWLILDLRSNGGGSFFAAIDLASYFVPQGQVVVSEKDVQGMSSYSSDSGKLQDMGLLVLENQWTASASEVLAGALRDGAGALLIGSTSFGKGITQTLLTLPSGGAWKYTRSRYYTPSGFDLHGVGLSPDMEVEPPEDITNADYFSTDPALDPHLQAAVDYINSRP